MTKKPASRMREKAQRLRALGPVAPRLVYGLDLYRPRTGERRLSLPYPRPRPAIIIVAAMFAIFSIPYVALFETPLLNFSDELFSAVVAFLTLFWFLGWTVGVALLLLLLLTLLFGQDTLTLRKGLVTLRTDVMRMGFGFAFTAQGMSGLAEAYPGKNDGNDWRGQHLVFDYLGEDVHFGANITGVRAGKILDTIRRIAMADISEAEIADFRRMQTNAASLLSDSENAQHVITADAG